MLYCEQGETFNKCSGDEKTKGWIDGCEWLNKKKNQTVTACLVTI